MPSCATFGLLADDAIGGAKGATDCGSFDIGEEVF